MSYISRSVVLRVLAVAGLVAAAAFVLVTLFGDNAFGLIEQGSGDRAYLAVFGLVAADAVVPIFPERRRSMPLRPWRPTASSNLSG